MTTLCRNIYQAFNKVDSLFLPQVLRSPVYVQERCKAHHIKFYGLKNYWPKYTMMKDHRRRMTLKEYGPRKLQLQAIRKANFLPIELREIADHEIHTLPVDSHRNRMVFRCLVTSKPKGNVLPFNLGRHLFRHLADYNKLSGVQRAMW